LDAYGAGPRQPLANFSTWWRFRRPPTLYAAKTLSLKDLLWVGSLEYCVPVASRFQRSGGITDANVSTNAGQQQA